MPQGHNKLIKVNNILVNRIRIAALSFLYQARRDIEFKILLTELETTKGNLSTHMRKLEEQGLIQIKKEFVERIPKTSFRITPAGKGELMKFLKITNQILKDIS